MANGEYPLPGYNFSIAPDNENIYVFTTSHSLKYEVEFRPTFYLFENEPLLSEHTVELIISMSDRNRNSPFDELTDRTISTIITHFYQRGSLTTTLFICHDSDKRELARHRKFRLWFVNYNKEKFTKFDFEWTDKSENTIYISVIISIANPYASFISQRLKYLPTLSGRRNNCILAPDYDRRKKP